MLPRNHRQESLSKTYVRAIAAQAGLICSEPGYDYGIDLCLRAVQHRGQRFSDAGLQLDLQLKSTTRAGISESEIRFELEVNHYDSLRSAETHCPRLLVVFIMPEEEEAWVSQSEEELSLRHAAYWLSLRNAPPTSARKSIRVSLPRSNLFSVQAVNDWMNHIRKGSAP